jgi:hypothetical protein
VVHVGEMRDTCEMLVVKRQGSRPLRKQAQTRG